jgi:hypothetical protein
MRSKQINLKLTPSKLPLIALLLSLICGYIISHYIPQMRFFVFSVFVVICLFWLYKFLNFKEHNLIINTNSDCHALVACARNDSVYENNIASEIPVQIIKFRHISWWLSIICLHREEIRPQAHNLALDPRLPHACVPHACVRGGDVVIYLFADSVPLKSYKSFKIYSQWT